ncbi:uncharacterized protein EAF01_001142 [Botrytis porri]|uniref:uncharacterized protein n=1 Tax=Botrytis porri TaxID=87229 RepID=UPI001901EF05|nr:uncharacterized protein EAF01_001142 [Botrytis porri]KAF7912121.1 hypothetical protein EAF01_001142 [Botrytis porri]
MSYLAPGVFLCGASQSYLLANVLRPSFEHVLLAENPLQCYAALKIGAPSQFSISLRQKFMSDSVDHIDVLQSTFFSHNPRFIEMVGARYDKLKKFCHDTTTDAPETITSLFFSPAAIVLLQNLMGFRNSLNSLILTMKRKVIIEWFPSRLWQYFALFLFSLSFACACTLAKSSLVTLPASWSFRIFFHLEHGKKAMVHDAEFRKASPRNSWRGENMKRSTRLTSIPLFVNYAFKVVKGKIMEPEQIVDEI